MSGRSNAKKSLAAEILKAWGHFKNKRFPLDKCHLELLPQGGCLYVSLPTMHLDAHKHKLLVVDESDCSNECHVFKS